MPTSTTVSPATSTQSADSDLVAHFVPSTTDVAVTIAYFVIAITAASLNAIACIIVVRNTRVNSGIKIILSINRFSAVAYMGRYYTRLKRLLYVEFILLPLIPVTLMTLGTFYDGNCRFFHPLAYAVYNIGDFFLTMIPTLNWTIFALLIVAISLDTYTLLMLRIRLSQTNFKSNHGGNFTRTDMQLSKQMVATQGSGLFYLCISFVHQYTPAKLTLQPIVSFIANMFIPACFSCYIGLLTIIFLRQKKVLVLEKAKEAAAAPTSTSQAPLSLKWSTTHR
ncbi:unnamed protein product, partial [Mesorhabditis spiculigera]